MSVEMAEAEMYCRFLWSFSGLGNLGMPSKKTNFIWKEKFLSGGGGGKKKGPNFPSKRAKKVGN